MKASQFIYTFGTSLVYINTILMEKLLPLLTNKDLGIIISSNLNFSLHHETISSKAYRRLGLLCRTLVTHTTIMKKKLYLSLIRSQLTYCSQIWRPFLRKDILFIEKIQRRATKYILNDLIPHVNHV